MKISDYKNVGIIFNKDSGLINDDSLYRSIKSELGSNEKCILRFIDLEDSEELYEFYGGFKKICITELKKCDVVIVFGGDGTKNFVANMLIHYNIDIPILGISCGTMNVGKLTSICDNEFFMNNEYDIVNIDALSILVDEKYRYYAFHDIIVATTFVGNYKGKVTQLSAKKIISGEKREDTPTYIGDSRTRIYIKRCQGINTSFPISDKIGIIGIAELGKGLAANVLAGGADHPATLGDGAGVIMSPERYVWPSRTMDEFHMIEPVQSYVASFDYNDEVNIIKLKKEASFIIDGNALLVLDNQYCSITLKKDVVKILKLRKE